MNWRVVVEYNIALWCTRAAPQKSEEGSRHEMGMRNHKRSILGISRCSSKGQDCQCFITLKQWQCKSDRNLEARKQLIRFSPSTDKGNNCLGCFCIQGPFPTLESLDWFIGRLIWLFFLCMTGQAAIHCSDTVNIGYYSKNSLGDCPALCWCSLTWTIHCVQGWGTG